MLVPSFLLSILLDVACRAAGDINLGQRLKAGESWVSSGNTFAVGFTRVNSPPGMYNLAVWYNSVRVRPKTVVWTAMTLEDSHQPLLVTGTAQLELTNDALVVTEGTQTVWQTVIISCDQCISSAMISEAGNFVMLSSDGEALWESFDSPTDTLLPEQQLLGGMSLASGDYTLEMDPVRVMLRYKHYPTQPYWSITNHNLSSSSPRAQASGSLDILPKLVLDDLGAFTFFDGTGKSWNNSLTDNSIRYALDHGDGNVRRRLTLESTGSLLMYSLASDNSSWHTVWKANIMECDIFGVCGAFGICSYRPERTCSCPSGFHRVNETDPSAGCTYNVPLRCDAGSNKFVQLNRADYPWNDYNFDSHLIMSMERCKESCLNDCKCLAAAYKFQGTDLCFHKGNAGKLYNGVQSAFQENVVFLKVSAAEPDPVDDPFVTDVMSWRGEGLLQHRGESHRNKQTFLVLLSVAIVELVLLVALAVAGAWWLRRSNSKHK